MKKIILKIWFKLHSFIGNYYWLSKIKKNKELYSLMLYFQDKSNSTGVGYGDVYFLYSQILKRKPKNILEFGTGASTGYITLAIKDIQKQDKNYKPNFYSLEDNKNWYEHQISIFPEELKGFVKIINSKIKIYNEDVVSMAEFLDEAKLDWEFIHVDSGGIGGLNPSQVVKNTIDILNRSDNKNIFVVFDNRMIPTKETYKRIDKNKYIWDRGLMSWLVGNNIIRRKD